MKLIAIEDIIYKITKKDFAIMPSFQSGASDWMYYIEGKYKPFLKLDALHNY
jgi:hypothetical protein